jgi:hypothetical protein
MKVLSKVKHCFCDMHAMKTPHTKEFMENNFYATYLANKAPNVIYNEILKVSVGLGKDIHDVEERTKFAYVELVKNNLQ